MRAGFYARATSANPMSFSAGPFPSREDAIDEAPPVLGLVPGDGYEIGEWQTYTPRLSGESYLMLLFKSLAERFPEASEPWCLSVGEIPSADLDSALDLAFQGWLTRHAAHPNFGMVADVSLHTFQ